MLNSSRHTIEQVAQLYHKLIENFLIHYVEIFNIPLFYGFPAILSPRKFLTMPLNVAQL